MTTETEVVREVAVFVEHEPRSRVATSLREVFLGNDAIVVTPYADVREVALLSDNYDYDLTPWLREVALLNDRVTYTFHPHRTERELAFLASAIYGQRVVTEEVRDTAELNDDYVANTGVNLREVALLKTDTALGLAISPPREVARLSSRAIGNTQAVVRDTFAGSSAISAVFHPTEVKREVALLGDTASNTLIHAVACREVATLNDRLTARDTARGTLRETAYLYDRAVLPNSGRAYTCSVITWGMSTFKNFPFLTIAGNLAAGENLWRLDASTDYGAPIESYIKTGILDMGASRSKRVTAVYAAGSADAPLTLTVTGDVDGAQASYDYTLDLRDQTKYRNNRALVGKGFRSRFVQFTLGTSGPTQYRLLNAETDVAISQRRV